MENKKVIKEVGIAVGSSVVVTILFLVVIAVLMLKAGLGEDTVSKLMIAGYVLAPAVGGFLLGKKRKVNRFLWGLCVGSVYFVLYALLAVCMKDVPMGDIMWVAIPMCLGGMAGGMLS
ncbi:MAG: TIGR04086 family membrane protein [Lachnospiraceae bacterium]|nr:TIGR04086 family membrane protein [Lachnospiraceae bacterium]